ncbi:DUF4148 domain-containing protein [Pseudoduganella sp. FT55W]|uniref:DUF4148 domain-containing protein n=1 Tax=Duganella rivi TaxID=2666083 RepID=A0A7X4GRC7_9BURK|nr:DUF4148 domain-containing protein [Duganella rivi]MYM67711.1 DUF4148 domain-containing protein [Duganella rivi]
MKTIAFVLSAALFAATAATAQEIGEYSGNTSFVSTKTRAEVKAETLAAIQRGELRDGEQYPDPRVGQPEVKAKTHAEVKAELAAYRSEHKGAVQDTAL